MTIRSIAPLENEAGIIAGLEDGRIAIVLAADASVREIRGAGGPAAAWIASTADGLTIVAADTGGHVEFRRADDGGPELTLSWTCKVTSFAPLRDGRYVGSDSEGEVVVWSHEDDRWIPARLLRGGRPIGCSALTTREDGSVVLLGGLEWAVWDPESGAFGDAVEVVDGMQLRNQSGDSGLSRNGRFFYVYWDDLAVYDTATAAEIRTGDALWFVHATAISDDGRILAMGGRKGWVGAVDDRGSLLADLVVGTADVPNVAISRDGRFLAWRDQAGRGGLVDVETGRELLDAETVANALA